MATESSSANVINQLVVEYLDRKQAGDAPSIDEYCQQHPVHADELRSLLKTVDLAEADFEIGLSTAGVSKAVTPEPVPEQIAGYRILREVGRGGMGVVYEAEHTELERQAALKVLPSRASSDPQAVQRFLREGRAIARMHHSNIVPLFEVGEENGRFFLAMQLINGQSLDLLIRDWAEQGSWTRKGSEVAALDSNKNPTSPEVSLGKPQGSWTGTSSGSSSMRLFQGIAKIGVQAADALHYAHQRGLTHRDVKPSNLILDQSGVIWLTDFGLAKADDEDLTRTGDFVGTLRYMAPERFKGQCDERADIYALGLTIYELLALRPAFDSSDRLNTIRKITNEDPPRLRSINPQIPRDLETIVMKAIERESKARYSTAKALADDLSNFINDIPIKARRVSVPERFVRWSRRNKGLAAALVGMLALLLLIIGLLAITNFRERELRFASQASEKSATEATKIANDALARAEQRGNELNRNLYFAEVNRAGRLIGSVGSSGEAAAVVEKWGVEDGETQSVDFAGWELNFLRAYTKENVISLGENSVTKTYGSVRFATWSPDDTRIALTHYSGVISIWDVESAILLHTLKGHTSLSWCIDWHPTNHNLLATCSDDLTIRIWDVESEKEIRRFDVERQPTRAVGWDRTGQFLAWSSDSSVFIWDRSRPERKALELTGGPTNLTTLQWSPDSKCIAGTCWWQFSAAIWEVDKPLPIKAPFKCSAVKWADTGHDLVGRLLCMPTGEIDYYESDSKFPAQRFSGHSSLPSSPDWHVSGDSFVTTSNGRTVRIWDLESGLGNRIFQGHDSSVGSARFSHSGTRVVSTAVDQQAKVWSIVDPHRIMLRNIRDPQDSRALNGVKTIAYMQWAPDSRRICTTSYDGYLRVWDSSNRKLLHRKRVQPSTTNVIWDKNGSRVMYGTHVGAIELWEFKEDVSLENIFSKRLADQQLKLHRLDWDQDRNKILVAANDTFFRVWDEKKGKMEYELEFEGRYGSAVVWHPDHDGMFAASTDKKRISLMRDGQVVATLDGHKSRIVSLDWSPDGKQLASASQDGTLRVWDLATLESVHVLDDHHSALTDVDWSPDGKRIATSAEDGRVKLWDPVYGTVALTLNGNSHAMYCVAWSPDGMKLAAGDVGGDMFIWDATDGFSNADLSE